MLRTFVPKASPKAKAKAKVKANVKAQKTIPDGLADGFMEEPSPKRLKASDQPALGAEPNHIFTLLNPSPRGRKRHRGRQWYLLRNVIEQSEDAMHDSHSETIYAMIGTIKEYLTRLEANNLHCVLRCNKDDTTSLSSCQIYVMHQPPALNPLAPKFEFEFLTLSNKERQEVQSLSPLVANHQEYGAVSFRLQRASTPNKPQILIDYVVRDRQYDRLEIDQCSVVQIAICIAFFLGSSVFEASGKGPAVGILDLDDNGSGKLADKVYQKLGFKGADTTSVDDARLESLADEEIEELYKMRGNRDDVFTHCRMCLTKPEEQVLRPEGIEA